MEFNLMVKQQLTSKNKNNEYENYYTSDHFLVLGNNS